MEARALGLIRDALESLEGELEALQVVCMILFPLVLFYVLVLCGILACEGRLGRVLVSWILDSVLLVLFLVFS